MKIREDAGMDLSRILKGARGKLKPKVSKRNLLLVAGLVWASASAILISKGALWVLIQSDDQLARIIAAVLFGIVFYKVLFTRISGKHIERIVNMERENPFVLAFFDGRGYVMMAGMIALGIALRNLDFVNKDLLYTFYIGMGIPLLFSAFRFYIAWITFQRVQLRK